MTFPKRDEDAFNKMGGILYDKAPVKNANNGFAVDLSSDNLNQCRASAAGLSAVSMQAYLKYDNINNKLVKYEVAWDKIRSNLPTIDNSDSYVWVLIFPNTIIDVMGEKQILNLIAAIGNVDMDNSSVCGFITCEQINNRTFHIHSNLGNLKNNITGFDLFIY
jgi:hypothetical protein